MNSRGYLLLGWVLVLAAFLRAETASQAALPGHRLPGHTLPASVTSGAHPYVPQSKTLQLAVRLPLRNAQELDELLERLYAPGDSLQGNYLSVEEFTARFGATNGDFDRVVAYFSGLGCAIGTQHANRLLLDVECQQDVVEHAFGVKVSHWLTPDNEMIRTIDTDPTIPDDLPIEAIHGLASVPRQARLVKLESGRASPLAGGSGPNGGLSPSDINTAYNLNGVAASGAGQTLALFELDGYQASDITAYKSAFGIASSVALQNVLIDGFNGSAGSGAPEVTLDIELMMAIAPGAAKILVYEGPNTDAGVIDVYQRIANDNVARQVSTSWGIAENLSTSSELSSENAIFKQMAAQGQTIYAASGDSGAFDDGTNLSVDDPASQPYMAGAGGTTLTTNPDHTYARETTWWDPTKKWGGGGGVSTVWSIPSWQVGVISSSSLGSTTHRNVPDVALNSDPATGYAIYVKGSWAVYGGTSCAAPLWAGFTARVNQKRASGGLSPLGFANPQIYQVGKGASYGLDFHDVADGSTNGHYPAVVGYDLATGWGTLNGANLLVSLAGLPTPSPSPTPSPTPPPGGGCGFSNRKMNPPESTGAAVSLGLPFVVGFLSRRRRKQG